MLHYILMHLRSTVYL